MPARCQHCQLYVINRPRLLCHRCYQQRNIRMLYARHHGNRNWQRVRDRKLPARPTRALPGSLAKLQVFEQRFRRREQLFHPDDA